MDPDRKTVEADEKMFPPAFEINDLLPCQALYLLLAVTAYNNNPHPDKGLDSFFKNYY